ncbi:MAG: N-acetylmuramoyl-L-alanine amidase [Phycisphaerales bacterium]|nr:N-acetylmuramoyl-L-alanine amidase [Phycisphaerales bacterium]
METPQPSHSASRRRALQIGAKAGSFIALSGVIAGLTGCNSSSKRSANSKNMIGQPIPEDPVFTATAPQWNGSSVRTPAISSASLTQLPSFVIPRTKWTRGKTKVNLADPMQRITRITVHHDAISPLPSGQYAESVRRLTAIRRGHLGNHWADIGYHYAIDPAGRAWQARPLVYQGAHVKEHNPGNIGIVMFGNYEHARPTSQALSTLNNLIAHEMRRFNVPLSRVYTHRELRSTACPGKHLQAQMIRLRQPNGALAQALSSTPSLINA